MGDGIKNKYALVINPDTEVRHLNNVESALTILENQNYETHVLSSAKPQNAHDRFATANLDELKRTVGELRARIDNDDEILIYTTGHGDFRNNNAQICLDASCSTADAFELLNFSQAGQRVIVMDQCFSGGTAQKFLAQPKTLFISPGSDGETVSCGQFAPHFWSKTAPDLNQDGIANWQERYEYALSQGQIATTPQFIHSLNFDDAGAAAFPNTVFQTDNAETFEAKLDSLKPGQYAVVTFSASWCGPCKIYRPQFEKFASEAGGQHLFLRTENEELARKYGAQAYPTVMVFDHNRKSYIVENRDAVLSEITKFNVPFSARLAAILKGLQSNDPIEVSKSLSGLNYLTTSLDSEQAEMLIATLMSLLTPESIKQQGGDNASDQETLMENYVSQIAYIMPSLLAKLTMGVSQKIFGTYGMKLASKNYAEKKAGFYFLFFAYPLTSIPERTAIAHDIINFMKHPEIDDYSIRCAQSYLREHTLETLQPIVDPYVKEQLQLLSDPDLATEALHFIYITSTLVTLETLPLVIDSLWPVFANPDYEFDTRHQAIRVLQDNLSFLSGEQTGKAAAVFQTILNGHDEDLANEVLIHFIDIPEYLAPAEWEELRPKIIEMQSDTNEEIRRSAYAFEVNFAIRIDNGKLGNPRLASHLLEKMLLDPSLEIQNDALIHISDKLNILGEELSAFGMRSPETLEEYAWYFKALDAPNQNMIIDSSVKYLLFDNPPEQDAITTLYYLHALSETMKDPAKKAAIGSELKSHYFKSEQGAFISPALRSAAEDTIKIFGVFL